MVRHIVMWKFLDSAEGSAKSQNLGKARAMLEELKSSITVIRRLEVGIGMQRGDQAYDLVLSADFDSVEALDSYQAHPAHQEVVKFLRKVQSQKATVDCPC